MSSNTTKPNATPGTPSTRRRKATNVTRAVDNPLNLALAYLAALALAEGLAAVADPVAGQALHLLLLVILLLHAAIVWRRPLHRFLLSLAFVPLIRVISLSMPLSGIPLVFWYLIVSVPLFASAFIIMRTLRLRLGSRSIKGRGLLPQIAFGLTGLGFGYIEYHILQPEPLLLIYTWDRLLIASLVLVVSTGALEELIFRGIMQRTSVEQLGKLFGIFYIALLFAVLHIGYRSLLDVIFVLAIGLLFGWYVSRTGSLFGVTLSHSLTNIILFLVMPYWLYLSGTSEPAPLQALFSEANLETSLASLATARPTPTSAANLVAPLPQPTGSVAGEIATPSPKAPLPTPQGAESKSSAPKSDIGAPIPNPTAPAFPSPSPTLAAPPCGDVPPGWQPYLVRPGDTLFRLALARATTLQAVEAANCLAGQRLLSNSTIMLPPAASATEAAPPATAPSAPEPPPITATAPPAGAPVWLISYPTAGAELAGTVRIIGTASFDPAQAQFYKIELGSGPPDNIQWVTVGQPGYLPVLNDTLELLYSGLLAPGTYQLRLILVAWDGNYYGQPYVVQITVR